MTIMRNSLSTSFMAIVLCAIFTTNILVESVPLRSEHIRKREQLIKRERSAAFGSDINLDEREQVVSDYLIKEKKKVFQNSLQGDAIFYPAQSFFKSKPLVEQSPIYKLIKIMPKGAALHNHDLSLVSIDWLVNDVTYRDNLYMCVNDEHYMFFKFLSEPISHPVQHKLHDGCEWTSVRDERAKASDIKEFDDSIRRNLTLLATDPLATYDDVNDTWERFITYFQQVSDIILYTPVFGDYFEQALKEFYEDNVQYMELRGQLGGIAELDGSTHDAEFGLNIYRTVTKDFVKQHPDFAGSKFIMTGQRSVPKKDILEQIKVAMDLHEQYPDSFLGYDLALNENANNPLIYYLDELLLPNEQDPPINLPYFFHAGETKWQDTWVDYNLLDALLLNTTRIGHGYGLYKHPALLQWVKEKQVPIEVNPLSNQLLGLVNDLRNHAAVPLLADNFPIVICSDDRAPFETTPLSHDFFMAFMNMCGQDTGLGFLKQLAINSIKFSAMTEPEKASTMKLWHHKWDQFISESLRRISSGDDIFGEETYEHCQKDGKTYMSDFGHPSENPCNKP